LCIFIFNSEKNAPWKLECSTQAQDLGLAADVDIKSHHIHAPPWLAWVPVHGEAQ
jgi:hypothetical protein